MDTMTGNDGDTTGLLGDDRGRVPFAIIAVLLLVSAVTLVGYLETRDSGDIETDAALAMDRTDAAIQTTLRDATARAAQQAAAEPLTDPANTSFGDALDGDRPFVSYLEALVYLDASERFEAAGQRVGDVQTTVSLPAVTDAGSFEAAIERVDVEETEPGLLRVELGGIRVTATRNGDQLATRTETVTVSVPTPVLQQHERTRQFQQRLDAGVTSGGSFSQRFNARVYALGWARGYAQYGGLPVTEVIANRHIEPAANSALYRTQQDVFGTADPTLENAVRRGWFCMAAQDAQELYDGYNPGERDVADELCAASEWILGEKHTGELPDIPETVDLLGAAPGMDEERTIGVNETAYAPIRALVAGSGEHSIERALNRTFTIEALIDGRFDAVERPAFDHERPHPNATVTDTVRRHEGVTVDGGTTRRGNATNGTYYRFSNVETGVEIAETRDWQWTENGSVETATTEATGTLDVTVTVGLAENDTAPDVRIDEFNGAVGVDHEYTHGPASPAENRTVPAPGFRNYAGAEVRVPEAVVGGTNLSAFGGWLGKQWEGVTAVEGLALPDTRAARLELGDEQERLLVSTALDDVTRLQRTVENITHTFDRTNLVHAEDETGPVGRLASAVESRREAYLDRETAYESVGQRAVYEIRHAYFEVLLDELWALERAHGEVMGELDSHLDDVDSSLDHALSFLRQGVTAERPEPVPIESPGITPEITYEVSGSPTYLAGEVVTTDEVPAVSGGEFSPFAAKNENYLKLPYETIVSGILDSLRNLLGLGDPDAELTLRTAGEALRGGELAETAAAADPEYADSDELGGFNDELRGELDAALDEFAIEMGIEVTSELYDVEPMVVPPYYRNATHVAATNAAMEATRDVLGAFDTTAEAAIAIGAGNATEPLVAEIGEALANGIARPGYARRLTDGEWEELVASAVRPALDRAATNSTATLDGTDLVEDLDTATRQALENVSADILRDRLAAHIGNGSFDLGEYEDWVGDGDSIDTPIRVPAGLPLLPFPTKWVATMNLWDIDADGTYARFEVKANMSAPGRGASTTYVRENATVEREIGGENRTLGAVEPIGFDGRSLLIVVVPPGGIGVGDRDDENPECTETYPVVGAFDGDEAACPADP